ncbi:hypothetical protein RchiOBHm_Chr5g0038171 [Rosa chinensis]|uniref:Uncharacterized protein n=1 Tax=Rosa chinensis TaxID=74649 RepID=A0A2P6QBY1_ROSCH|nr:hypothetical protein RchiOBHm_Chr5g0038171 [Rosa chinensis]
MNGMQIPARASSVPPTLDEQKHDQARLESFRPAPSLPSTAVPMQLPRKDQPSVDQSSAAKAHLQPKAKKDVQVSPTTTASQSQKPSGPPMHGILMTSMPFHQPQVSVQFGGLNQQILFFWSEIHLLIASKSIQPKTQNNKSSNVYDKEAKTQ